MNYENRQIMEQCKLKPSDLRHALRVSRQAISRGLNDDRSSYLSVDRLIEVYRFLDHADDERSVLVKAYLEEDDDRRKKFHEQVGIPDDPTNTEFRRIIILSSAPHELESEQYQRQMAEYQFRREGRTITYIMPRGGRLRLMRKVLNSLASTTSESSHARVLLIVDSRVALVPHTLILEPASEAAAPPPVGLVITADGHFRPLPSRQVGYIYDALHDNGVLEFIDLFEKGVEIVKLRNLATEKGIAIEFPSELRTNQ